MLLNEKITELKKAALTPDGASFKMRVPVLQADQPNLNRRTYPLSVVKAAVEDLRAKLKKRTAFGSTKHEDALELDQVSHVVEDISLDEKGLASAVVRIFNTQRGRNLAAIIKGGGSVGVSARGQGEVKEGVVQTGYKLLGVDFTLDPSFSFKVNKECAMFESREVEEDDDTVTEEQLKEFGLIENEPILTKEQLADRYFFALSAGFRGTFAQYCESLNSKKG